MSIISGSIVKDYYFQSDNGWYHVNMKSFQNAAQADEINTQCISDARIERLKAIGSYALGICSTLALAGIALLIAKISSLVAGIFALPLAIIPPFYNLVNLLVGISAGGAFGYITIKRYAKQFFEFSQDHWAYANHLYQQAHAVRLKILI